VYSHSCARAVFAINALIAKAASSHRLAKELPTTSRPLLIVVVLMRPYRKKILDKRTCCCKACGHHDEQLRVVFYEISSKSPRAAFGD
jgi:hypothetical protein